MADVNVYINISHGFCLTPAARGYCRLFPHFLAPLSLYQHSPIPSIFWSFSPFLSHLLPVSFHVVLPPQSRISSPLFPLVSLCVCSLPAALLPLYPHDPPTSVDSSPVRSQCFSFFSNPFCQLTSTSMHSARRYLRAGIEFRRNIIGVDTTPSMHIASRRQVNIISTAHLTRSASGIFYPRRWPAAWLPRLRIYSLADWLTIDRSGCDLWPKPRLIARRPISKAVMHCSLQRNYFGTITIFYSKHIQVGSHRLSTCCCRISLSSCINYCQSHLTILIVLAAVTRHICHFTTLHFLFYSRSTVIRPLMVSLSGPRWHRYQP